MPADDESKIVVPVLIAAFAAIVIAANLAVKHWGIVDMPWGLDAPAGVFFAGLAFGFRDALHERGGRSAVLWGIGCGTLASLFLETSDKLPGGLVPVAIASGTAFALSELADMAVYEPLRQRQLVVAALMSNLAGAVADSALFLWLAFGSLDHMAGQVVWKFAFAALMLPCVFYARRRCAST